MYGNRSTKHPVQEKEVALTLRVAWCNGEIEEQVVDRIVELIYEDLKPKAEEIALAKLDDVVNKTIADVMKLKVQRHDRWGDPIESKTTVKELLEREAGEWLTERVTEQGKTPSRYHRGEMTRAQFLFREVIGKSLASKVKDTIRENVGDISEMVEAEVRRQIKKLAA